MKKIRKTLAVCLTASVLAASSAVSASAAAFSDVSGHWAEPTINQWVDRGYINGYPDGTFKPNHPITRTEFALVINRAFHFQNTSAIYFPDVSQTFWGYGEIQKAYAAGYMKGDANGTFRPNANVTRQEAAIVLANIKGLSFSGSAPYYSDSSSISSWARGSVNAVSAAGYMSGYPNGTFAPRDSLTRAQAVTMLNKAMNTGGTTTNPYVPPAQSTTDSVQNMTLQNTTLRNTIVNGDLTIPSSMSSRSITLDNVTVRGKLNLEGGGTITAEDCVINELVMDKSSAVFRAEDGTSVAKTTFRANGTLEGDRFQDVSIANSKVNTVTIDAEVENLTLDTDADMRLYGGAEIETFEITKNADDALIELSRGACVRNMNIRDGVRIAGDGDIDNMTVYVSGVRSEIEPDSLSRRSGAGKPDFDWEYNGKRHESSGSSSSSSSSTSKTISNNFDGNGGKYKNVRITDAAKVKDMRITGNLTIDEDVENGTVRLVDLEIDGDVYVYGGGKNSVIFENCEIDGDIISDKDSSASKSQTVALEFDSRTIVRGEIRILNDTILRESSGSPELNNVVVEKKGVELDVDIDIDTLELEKSAEVNIRNGVTIDTLKTNRGIGESTIDMDGSSVIKTVDARSDVDIRGTGTVNKVNKDSGVDVTLGDGIKNEPEQPSKPGSVTSVTLDKTTASVEVGKTTTLKATVATPDSGTDQNVTWSSGDEKIATVSDKGVVTGVKEGTAKITATSKADTTKSATCTVTVEKAGTLPDPDDPDAPVEKPTVYPAKKSVMKGAKVTLTLKFPEDYAYQTIDWAVASGNDFVALPSDIKNSVSVELSAIKAGEATVKATIKDTDGKLLAEPTSVITVTENSTGENLLQSVAIGWTETGIPINNWSIKPTSDSNQLAAILSPQDAAYKKIEWASDDNTIIEPNLKSGKRTYLEAKGADGEFATITLTVTAENGDTMTADCVVTISNDAGSNVKVEKVELNKNKLDLKIGEKETLTATVTPSTAVSTAVEWISSNPQVASVSKDGGEVTAIKEGTAVITAASVADKTKKATCTVTVKGSSGDDTDTVTAIEIREFSDQIPGGWGHDASLTEIVTQGDAKRVKAVLTPSTSNAEVIWEKPNGSSVNVEEATEKNEFLISSQGNVEQVDFKVKAGSFERSYQVNVLPKVEITNWPTTGFNAGNTISFGYQIAGTDSASENMRKKYISLKKDGTTITLEDGVPKDGWEFQAQTEQSGTATLKIPDNASGTYEMKFVGGVDGYVSEVKKEFTVTGGSSSNVSVTGVAISPTGEQTLSADDTLQLAATVAPNNATNKTVAWSSSDPNIASVSDAGLVTANKAGTATITVTTEDGSKTDSVAIKVNPTIKITGVDPEGATVQQRQDLIFTYEAKGLQGNATITAEVKDSNGNNVVDSGWSVEESLDQDAVTVSTVDEKTGEILPDGGYTFQITVTETIGDVSYTATDSMEFTVEPEVLTGTKITKIDLGRTTDLSFTLSMNQPNLNKGGIVVAPNDAEDQTLIWHSNPVGIVELTDEQVNGSPKVKIKALKAGTTTAWATAKVGGIRSENEFTIKVNPGVTITAPTETTPAIELGNPNVFSYAVNGFDNITADEVSVQIKLGVDAAVNENQWVIDKSTPGQVTVTPSTDVTKGKTYKIIITVTRDGCTGSVEKTFTVKEATVQTVPVTGIELTSPMQGAKIEFALQSRGGMLLGGGQDFSVKVLPENATNKKVIWSSSDPEVACPGELSGDKVMVEPKGKAGKATITAKTEDGNFTASHEVTAVKKEIKSVSLPNITMKVGDEPKKLAADIIPDDAYDVTATWISSDPSVATVNEGGYVDTNSECVGTIRAVAPGTTTITVNMTGELSNNKTATCTVTVEAADSESGGTSEETEQTPASTMSLRQNTVQTVQQQSAPRTFSFIPQREVQSKPTAPVVTVEPVQEPANEPVKEPEKVQEPEKEQEPVKEPETAQKPEKTPEEVQEPEKTPEQTQGIALTCADSFKAGETLTLSGTVNGVSGALRKIEWSIRDAGATGAAIRDGVMSAEQAGTVTVAATVQNSTTTEIFTITVLPGDEPKADEPIAQEPAETEPQTPVPGVQPETPAEGQAPAVTAPAVQTGAVTLPNGQVIPNAKKYQRSVGTIIALSGLDALPANAAADSVIWKAESLGTTGAALQMQDNTLVSVNANTAGVILLSRTVKVTNADGSAAIMTTYYEITIA